MRNSQQKVFSDLLVTVLVQLALCDTAVVIASSPQFDESRSSDCLEVCRCDEEQHLVDCGYRSLVRSPLHVSVMAQHYTIAGNRIYWISAHNLVGLERLISLDLSENFISELPDDLFVFTPQLSTLRLNGNRLKYIPTASLLKLHNLQQLFLSRNQIFSLSGETTFSSLSLLTLDLSGNEIMKVPNFFLDRFPQLQHLRLSNNHLNTLEMKNWTGHKHEIEVLDVSSNIISRLVWNDVVFHNVKVLNVSDNLLKQVDASWFIAMPNLHVLQLCANLFDFIADNTFDHASRLSQLFLCKLPYLQHIDVESFTGLPLLQELDLSNSYNLSSIHPDAFRSLSHLRYLDVRNNRLRTLQLSAAGSSLEAANVYLAGSQWLCDCHLKWMYDAHVTRHSDIGHDIVCSAPPELHDIPLFDAKEHEFSCGVPEWHHHVNNIVSVQVSSSVVLDCPVEAYSKLEVLWTTSRGMIFQSVGNSEQLSSFKRSGYFVFNRGVNITDKFANEHFTDGHFSLLKNGSLLVKDITRGDTGRYVCTVVNDRENFTSVIELRLDYSCLSSVMQFSVLVGGASALAFLLMAVILGTVRLIAYKCSADERKKRRSLRELISQMRNNSQFDRFSAYRAAQMDKLSAFKSATMDHLSSFTTTRIGRLRKYKQATVSCVLHHLERMREHYSVQMDHIKESYRMRTAHVYMAKFHDSRSMSVRKQYRARVAGIRDYTNEQIVRLREQYKQQQQYLLKLLELIDVGSCVSSSVEAECIKAESAIFDATVEFDAEARPSYPSRADDRELFASSSSLPDECRRCALPAGPPTAADFCDVDDDYCDDDVTVAFRATSFASIQVHKPAAEADCADDPLLRASFNSVTVSCQKALSSPAVVSSVTDSTDGNVDHVPEQSKDKGGV